MSSVFWSLLVVGLLMSAYRIIRGPSLFDRIVGLDTLTIILIGFLVVFAIFKKQSFYLDIALVFAALSFLETVVLAKFVGGDS